MKTVVTLGVGFWLGRQLYMNYDRKNTLRKERALKKRLSDFLEQQQFSEKDIEKIYHQILK